MSERVYMPEITAAHIPGQVLTVRRAPGDFASEGDPVLDIQLNTTAGVHILTICSPRTGKVMRSRAVGEMVKAGDRLIEVASVGAGSHEVFVAYRQNDSMGHTGRICDALQLRFGPGQVFRDTDNVTGGANFADVIRERIATAHVMLVVIGPGWAADRRLDEATDLHREEVRTGLERGIHVIPVRVGGAAVPPQSALPEDIRPLLDKQAVELTDARWAFDIGELLRLVESFMETSPARTRFLQQVPPETRHGWQWIEADGSET